MRYGSVVMATSKEGFTFVDLFAGIGGFRLGLESVGGTCLHTVEWDRFARQTYGANFNEPEGCDIRSVDSLPAHDVLAAGFPCQPFSIAGVSKKLSLGRLHGFQDKTQGTLFFELKRLIRRARPRVVLLENVKNLLSHDQGRTIEVITESLDQLGYNVSLNVVDARHWLPQHRERTFIVGFRRDLYGLQCFEFPRPPAGAPVLSSILETTVDAKYTLSEHLWVYLQEYAEKHRLKGNGFGYGLVTGSSVSRTLSARYHKDGSEILIDTGGPRPRRLTPRECARLMGFPESFKIVVSDTQAYRQFGNAVAVPVAQFVGRAIVEQAQLGFTAGDEPSVRQMPLGLRPLAVATA